MLVKTFYTAFIRRNSSNKKPCVRGCGEGSIAIRNRLKVSYPLEPSGKGLRESLREAVVVAVAKVGADGEFQRYSRIRSVIPKKK